MGFIYTQRHQIDCCFFMWKLPSWASYRNDNIFIQIWYMLEKLSLREWQREIERRQQRDSGQHTLTRTLTESCPLKQCERPKRDKMRGKKCMHKLVGVTLNHIKIRFKKCVEKSVSCHLIVSWESDCLVLLLLFLIYRTKRSKRI